MNLNKSKLNLTKNLYLARNTSFKTEDNSLSVSLLLLDLAPCNPVAGLPRANSLHHS